MADKYLHPYDYWDWYDNGPGSESYKRELLDRKPKKEFPNLPGFPFYKKEQGRVFWTLREKEVETKEYLPEELFEI
jgi:hypothetical protein